MPSLNKVMLMGNLTRDPDIRSTKSGIPVGDLGLAVNERFKDRNGQPQERTCFVDVVVWDKLATLCGERLHKGSPIFVEGRLEMDEWTDAEGQKKTRIRVRSERVIFLDSRPKDAEGPEAAGEPF
ncbi:MAG: single-stranded DNA-binding protein [Kiritimatiellia bacterium]|nr:single-stranded DNA-binding protein [Kiritimatiellia bacterium]